MGEVADAVAGDLAVVVEAGSRPPDLVVVLDKGLAALAGHDLGQLVDVIPQIVGDLVEELGPVEPGEGAPLLEALPGSVCRPVYVLAGGDRDLLYALLGRRVDDLQGIVVEHFGILF